MVANKGIMPIGLMTTKRAMVDLKRSSPKTFKKENSSWVMLENASGDIEYMNFYLLLKFNQNLKLIVHVL
jgi:hypothetical protein